MHSDGAAAIVLVSGEKAKKLGLQVIARIRGYADAAQVTLCMTPVLIHCLNKFCVNEGNYPFSWNQYLFSIQWCVTGVLVTLKTRLSWLITLSIILCLLCALLSNVGTRAVYNSSSSCYSKGYIKCSSSKFTDWLLWNKWGFLCKFLVFPVSIVLTAEAQL